MFDKNYYLQKQKSIEQRIQNLKDKTLEKVTEILNDFYSELNRLRQDYLDIDRLIKEHQKSDAETNLEATDNQSQENALEKE